ncbi:MAG: endonuclease/exonuclease/phosphatase family protein [Bacteroidales bacterium]
MTWNLENFPKNGQTTIEQVSQLIWDIDADVIAVQEVSNINAFDDMVNYLQGYEGYLESDWFGGLAYIYKTSVVQINDIYEIYTASPYWSALSGELRW